MNIKDKAHEYAKKVHVGQVRKDGKDYITHPEEVASILEENGAKDYLVAAGYLHDTIEDAKVDIDDLKKNFPDEVTSLVIMDSEDKSLSWEKRKENTIKKLMESNNRDLCMLVCADKLSNMRSMYHDSLIIGDEIWKRFKRGKDSQKWLYGNLLSAIKSISDLKMYQELEDLYKKLFLKEIDNGNQN